MKILVIGATGMVGSRVVAELLQRDHTVTAATRSGAADNLPEGVSATIALDATDSSAVAQAAAGYDAVVSAVSPPRDGSEPTGPLLEIYRSLVAGLRDAGVRRLLVVGGAGSLTAPSGQDRVDESDFPALYKGEALAQREVLRFFRAEVDDLDWTYVSPADGIAPGERTGAFQLGEDELLFAEDGSSFISAEDYAVALVDELEQGKAVRRRITLAY